MEIKDVVFNSYQDAYDSIVVIYFRQCPDKDSRSGDRSQ